MPTNHPLSDFHFCPHCGSPRFVPCNAHSKRCEACGFTFYPNAAAATVAVIVNDRHELLCTVRGREPHRGTLDLPGGFVDPGESLTEGLLREVREEVGAEVEAFDFIESRPNTYLYSGHVVHTCDSFFRCRLRAGEALRPADDVAALRYVAIASLQPADFGLPSVSAFVASFKERYPAEEGLRP